jgi:hypothetical protein
VSARNLVTQCRTVLLLVHELHFRGFQRLRVIPAMDPSGRYWRCGIAPVTLVSVDHGARLADGVRGDPRIATYSSRDRDRYFAWTDVYPYATPKELATLFVDRFPRVVEAGCGADWSYAGWYMDMLRLTHPDHFPYAAAQCTVPDSYVPTASPARHRRPLHITLPPPGEARTRPESASASRGRPSVAASLLHRAPRGDVRRLAG